MHSTAVVMRRDLNLRLFSTDLDGTLLGHPEAAWRFVQAWEALEAGYRPLLVYNTSRSVRETQGLIAARMLVEPDFIIGSLGTELHDSLYNFATEFHAQLGRGWDRAKIDALIASAPGPKRQPDDAAPSFKSSWTWLRARREQVEDLRQRLGTAGFEVTVCYSCQHFLDVVPACAGKGPALHWLCRRLGIALDRVIVAGDTAQDSSMFLLPGVRGIAVENALPELHAEIAGRDVFITHFPLADGVLEGLTHFGMNFGIAPFGSIVTPA